MNALELTLFVRIILALLYCRIPTSTYVQGICIHFVLFEDICSYQFIFFFNKRGMHVRNERKKKERKRDGCERKDKILHTN